MGYHGNRLVKKSIISGKLFILKVLWMCKVSSKSVKLHFPNLRKNPWFSLTTALKPSKPFVVLNPWTDSFFHFEENIADVVKENVLETSPMPLNHLIWKCLHRLPSYGENKNVLCKKKKNGMKLN